MQNLSLEEIQTASLKSPRWGNAPHLPDESAREDAYEDKEGESGNTCEWTKAKSPTLLAVQELAPRKYADDSTVRQ